MRLERRKALALACVITLVSIGSTVAVARARKVRRVCVPGTVEISPTGGEGNDVPSPFDTANQHVELADSEAYQLYGRVVLAPALPGMESGQHAYFSVDLNEHPWLANSARRESALYPLDGSPIYWKHYQGMYAKFAVIAHGRVLNTVSGPSYVIFLEADNFEIEEGRN